LGKIQVKKWKYWIRKAQEKTSK